MKFTRKIRVLVVDDSLVFREILSRGISSNPSIEVVAVASNPFEARDKIIEYKPDIMTCDIEMPKMNGIEFLRRLIPQYPLPTIIVSAVSDAVFDALNSGAVDFVTKPDARSAKSVACFIEDLIEKIKIAVNAKVVMPKYSLVEKIADNKIEDAGRVIAIGASTGGTEAISQILSALPPTIPGIVVVQHIPHIFSRMFAERLDKQTNLRVKEAQSGDYLGTGTVLIAPGDQHMVLRKIGDSFKVDCFFAERVNGHCPSVDVLFESVAKEAGNRALGVILTGMGYDGAKGLMCMRRKGARTIGQDQASSIVYGMPKVAYDIGAVEKQASLRDIPQLICKILK